MYQPFLFQRLNVSAHGGRAGEQLLCQQFDGGMLFLFQYSQDLVLPLSFEHAIKIS